MSKCIIEKAINPTGGDSKEYVCSYLMYPLIVEEKSLNKSNKIADDKSQNLSLGEILKSANHKIGQEIDLVKIRLFDLGSNEQCC